MEGIPYSVEWCNVSTMFSAFLQILQTYNFFGNRLDCDYKHHLGIVNSCKFWEASENHSATVSSRSLSQFGGSVTKLVPFAAFRFLWRSEQIDSACTTELVVGPIYITVWGIRHMCIPVDDYLIIHTYMYAYDRPNIRSIYSHCHSTVTVKVTVTITVTPCLR